LCKALTDMDDGKLDSTVKRETVVSWLSEMDLILAYMSRMLWRV
jgi:hypothetical protein